MAKAKKPKHVAIAGNIGAGKTTLTEMLSKHYRWIPQFEDVDHNPYLMDFYDDMTRWSFNLQIYFLHGRLNQILEIQRGTETVIQDRTIYEDANIFAPNLHEMGLMSKRDFDNYFEFFSTIKTMVQPPDLLIYLKASVPTLVSQIQKGTETVIQDRTIYEDANIFAPNLHEMGLMSKRDFDNYFGFFSTIKTMVQPPDLLIYLKASVPTLVSQIQKRGREYEENIRLDYLKKLNEYYNKWVDGYKEGPILIIDCDKNILGESEEDLGEIISKVYGMLYGLF
jgi:deoxyadenosine/deoxycytidine kinase